jgi:hypothetical protein
VARNQWESGHGDYLGNHEEEWGAAQDRVVEDWNKSHPDAKVDPENVGYATEMIGHRTPEEYDSRLGWYEEKDDTRRRLPLELAGKVDALESKPLPYPGIRKAIKYWRESGDDDHLIPVIAKLKVEGDRLAQRKAKSRRGAEADGHRAVRR